MVELVKVLYLFMLFSPWAFAGNGSSGVGNGPISIVGNIIISDFGGSIERNGSQITTKKSNTPLIEISEISRAKVQELQRKGIIFSSYLGGVSGFEKLSENNLPNGYWIVCDQNYCKKLIPLSDSSPLVPGVIGSLQELERLSQ